MTPKDNSLQKYNYGLTNSGQPANNFCRPNVTNFKPESGRLYQIQYENIMTSSPKVDWNSYNTKDPILNFGSTSTDISGSGFIETVGKIASGISLFGGIAMTGLGIANAVKTMKAANSNQSASGVDNFSRKERKEINNNTTDSNDEMQALDSAITTAESLVDSDNIEEVKKGHENIMASITNAQKAQNEALRNKESAEKTRDGWSTKKTTEQNNYNKLLNQKTSINSKLEALKKTDTSNMSDAEKSALKEEIAQYEKDLKEIEKQLKKSKETIEEYDKQIAKYQQIVDNNTQVINSLSANIKSAQNLEKQLRVKTGVDQ